MGAMAPSQHLEEHPSDDDKLPQRPLSPMERARLSQVPLVPTSKEAGVSTAIRARALASMDYRADMLSRQKPAYLLRRASSGDAEALDTRRLLSWAPFAILPGALLCVRSAPSHLRVPLFGCSLVGFAAFSAGMWDTREDMSQ